MILGCDIAEVFGPAGKRSISFLSFRYGVERFTISQPKVEVDYSLLEVVLLMM
jgi:hypothetical protein